MKFFVLLLSLYISSLHAEERVIIGAILPLSGPAASMGESLQGAFTAAGLKNITVRFEDDFCDPKRAISAYQKLSEEGITVFYVACSGSILALDPLVKARGDLILTSYSGSATVRETGPEVIRFNPDAVSVARALTKLFNEDPKYVKYKKLIILHEEQDYATSLAAIVREDLKDRVVHTEPYLPTQPSFKSEIVRLKQSEGEAVIFIPVSDKAAAVLYREMKELRFEKSIIGEVNLCDYAIKPSQFGLHGACLSAEFTSDAFHRFEDQYRKANGRPSQYPFYDAITVDILSILDSYVAEHRSLNSSEIIPFLLKGVTGAVETYHFTPDGEVVGGDEYLKLKNM